MKTNRILDDSVDSRGFSRGDRELLDAYLNLQRVQASLPKRAEHLAAMARAGVLSDAERLRRAADLIEAEQSSRESIRVLDEYGRRMLLDSAARISITGHGRAPHREYR